MTFKSNPMGQSSRSTDGGLSGMHLMRPIRQIVLLIALMFWQGGFMFYEGVVVPVGSRVLGSDTQQGFITQAVTNYLNFAGVVCLVIWAENLWHERRNGVTKFESATLIIVAAMLGILAIIHMNMDRFLDSRSTSVVDPQQFGLYDKLYIGISSVQWLGSLVMLFSAIRRWNFVARTDLVS